MKFNQLDYICEYYNVSKEEAIKLGTRSRGRKPNLPGSKTCKPVSEMTMEDIWDLKKRKSKKDIYDFYIDQGAWSTFRQVIRHQTFKNYHISIFSAVESAMKAGVHICEYGCGVAPFSFSLANVIGKKADLDISLTDIEGCEHLNFANWSLNKLKEDRGLEEINIYSKPVKVNKLPTYDKKLDLVIIFEVLEHVPSPVATLTNLIEQMSPSAFIVENFIKHDDDHDHEEEDENYENSPDLSTAAAEREEYYNLLKSNFILKSQNSPFMDPNGTRIWQLR